MLWMVMRECRNFFPASDAVSGKFEIVGGALSLPTILPGQYYLIEGSIFNDGVHQNGEETLTDETFCGSVLPMAVPRAFVDLCERIAAWVAISGAPSAMQSESFGGYSYQKATGKNGGQMTWQQAFADDLRVWRKV